MLENPQVSFFGVNYHYGYNSIGTCSDVEMIKLNPTCITTSYGFSSYLRVTFRISVRNVFYKIVIILKAKTISNLYLGRRKQFDLEGTSSYKHDCYQKREPENFTKYQPHHLHRQIPFPSGYRAYCCRGL